MSTKYLHMKVGENIGEILLDICQTNISKGNIDKALNTYTLSLEGFTKEHIMKLLKNEAVLVVSDDGEGVNLSDDKDLINANAHNIFDWNNIFNERFNIISNIYNQLIKTESEFNNYSNESIINYSMIDMMKQYYTNEEIPTMSGTANIAARICGDAECKICDKGSSNPWSIWITVEGRVENYLADPYGYDYDKPAKWEIVLYLTVKYNKLIRMLHKEYMNFENIYLFLVENEFITKMRYIEQFVEKILNVLKDFADDTKGYYHPLCNTGLYKYKNNIINDLLTTKYGSELLKNGIIIKDIMDGYDAGWLSPDGEFYGDNEETSGMIHVNIADNIFDGNNVYANKMSKDNINKFGGINSPDYWLEQHGWIKIHNNEIYGGFIGESEKIDPEFPYYYCPTKIQIKMICDYVDKYYNGKLYTHPQIVRRTDPISTYKIRQMDNVKLHEIFTI